MTATFQTVPKSVLSAFTLIEVLVVLVIIGLLAAVATVRLQEPLQNARLGNVIQRIAFTDGQVRSHAQRFARRARLVYDLEKNLVYAESEAASGAAHLRFELPGSVQLDQVRLHRSGSVGRKATIEVTPQGQTPSYAVKLGAGDRAGLWLFFSGVTGQVTQVDRESDVEELLGLVSQ